MDKTRIQKALAGAGVASRRSIEQMILDGRITVNGQAVRRLPCFVTGDDEIRVDGQPIRRRAERKVYYLLNKPRGVVCTQRDERGRPRAVDLIDEPAGRVYCAGRLDADSTGLIVLTNDGGLTDHLTHPRYGVRKTYVVQIDGRLAEDQIARLKGGLRLDGRRTQPVALKVLRQGPQSSLLEITLSEGRNREIRRLLARLGHKVRRLRRVAIGPITDRGLKVGRWRRLKDHEVRQLQSASPQTTTVRGRAKENSHG